MANKKNKTKRLLDLSKPTFSRERPRSTVFIDAKTKIKERNHQKELTRKEIEDEG